MGSEGARDGKKGKKGICFRAVEMEHDDDGGGGRDEEREIGRNRKREEIDTVDKRE